MLRKTILLIALLLSISILNGCKEENHFVNKHLENNVVHEDNDKIKTLNIVTSFELPSLDPSISTDYTSFEVIGNTMEGLFALVGGDTLQYGVCEDYSISKDGLTYTFNLRKDSFWSNGEPVTAQDFAYSWKRLADPKIGTKYDYSFMIESANIKNGKSIINGEKPVEELGVYAKDKYTLILELDTPTPYLPNLLSFPSFYPINQTFAEEKGKFFGTSIQNTLFNGPYILDKWDREKEFVYKKNNNYWNKDNINIDVINVKIVRDPNTALNMYNNNEIDVITLVGEQVEEYLNHENLVNKLDTAIFYLSLNQENEILKNINARKAIALGFDKSYIVDEIFKNGFITADYFVPKNFTKGSDGKYFRDSTKTYNHYHKEEAVKYWAKAKKELNVESPTLTILTYDSEMSKLMSNYIKEQLESNLEGLTIDIAIQKFSGKLTFPEPEGDIEFAGWGPDYLDPMTFLDLWTTDNDQNKSKYSSKEYDNIIESSKTGDLATNLNKRWTELQRAEKILLEDDVVLVPLYQRGGYILLKDHITNWKYNSYPPDYYYGYMDIVGEN